MLAGKIGYFRATLDPAAAAYIAAVEAADGQALEAAVRTAINAFVVGCKTDGIWSAIRASCILMGARTLSGALVPLAGSAPTNFNFVSGDYNRKTGLIGNQSTKYIDAARSDSADGLNDNHASVYASSLGAQGIVGTQVFGSASATTISQAATRNRNTNPDFYTATVGLIGMSRASSASYSRRNSGSTSTVSTTSSSSGNANYVVFDTNGSFRGNHRLAFYSFGSSLNLALLDSRVTALYNAIGAAIP